MGIVSNFFIDFSTVINFFVVQFLLAFIDCKIILKDSFFASLRYAVIMCIIPFGIAAGGALFFANLLSIDFWSIISFFKYIIIGCSALVIVIELKSIISGNHGDTYSYSGSSDSKKRNNIPSYSEEDILGNTNYYDEDYNKIGHSEEDVFGTRTYYDTNYNKIGTSQSNVFNDEEYYDDSYNKVGYSERGITGNTNYYDTNHNKIGTSEEDIFGGEHYHKEER